MFLFRNPAVPRDQRPDHLLQHPGAGRGRGGGDQHPRGERPQQRRARRRRVRRAQAVRAARGRRRQVRPGLRIRAGNKLREVFSHKESPYYDLLLVESAYLAFTFKTLCYDY